MNANVYAIIAAGADAWGDDPAIVDSAGTLTYAQLQAEVEALKAQLLADGLQAGQGLGVMMQNSRAFVIGVFAGLGCGAAVMPLSHQLKPAELHGILTSVTLHAVLDDTTGPTPPGTGQMLALGPSMARQALRYTPTDQAPADGVSPNPLTAFIRFTSGTTGDSKGVAVTHQAVLERTAAAQRGLQLTRADAVVWVLPMAYHFIVSIVLYLRYGVKITVTRDVLARTIIDCTNTHAGTLLYAAPMHYRLLAADKSSLTMPSLVRAISTSSAIPVAVARAFQQRFGLPVIQAYGIIEIGLPIINLSEAESHPEAIGHALPDYDVGILDTDGTPVADGETGQLAIRGPGLFDAYLAPYRSRAQVEVRGWFLTGDLATRTATGLITVVGRKKSMINVSGNKVFPEEVEQVLAGHPAILQSRVSGVVHPLMGETVQAEVVLVDGQAIDSEDILRFCRQQLSAYKVPQFLRVVDAIAETGSGKIARA
ncbi:MAG: AMP-binding protein [Verrucomicrobia bacterium]|nr:AMP-binding protein [Verrucomicrobiota bacterium]